MRIDNENPLNRLHGLVDRLDGVERTGRTGEAAGPGATGALVAPRGDGIEISPRAREIAGLRAALDALPDVRAQLVEALRAEIATGAYRADSLRIADAMLDEERAFADRPGSIRP